MTKLVRFGQKYEKFRSIFEVTYLNYQNWLSLVHRSDLMLAFLD